MCVMLVKCIQNVNLMLTGLMCPLDLPLQLYWWSLTLAVT